MSCTRNAILYSLFALAVFGAMPYAVAPAAIPKDLIARLNADTVAVIRTPELAQRYAAQGTYPIADTPEQFAGTIKADIRRYADIIAKAGIKAE